MSAVDTMNLISTDSLRGYLQEIGRIPLLTAEEEVSLAAQIRAGHDAQLVLDNGTDAEGAALCRRLIRQGEEARDKLVSSNLRLVVTMAREYQDRGLSLQDLIQEGNIGLLKAADKYDPERGARFSTCAAQWIRQTIGRAVTDYGRAIRLPSHMIQQVSRLRRAHRSLTQRLDREPSAEELAAELGLSVERVHTLQRYGLEVTSLDAPVGDSEDSATLGELTGSVTPIDAVEDSVYRSTLQAALGKALSALDERERLVLRLRFGMEDGVCRTLDEIGSRLGITRERVRQLERRALNKLRSGDCGVQLKGFIA